MLHRTFIGSCSARCLWLKYRHISFAPVRPFAISISGMVSREDLAISEGEEGDAVFEQAQQLIDHGQWQLCNNGKGLERSFRFKTFKSTWDFMNHVANECKSKKHHPEWSNVYNKTHIRWTTHTPDGLSTKDTYMAKFCDEAGKQFGELPAQS